MKETENITIDEMDQLEDSIFERLDDIIERHTVYERKFSHDEKFTNEELADYLKVSDMRQSIFGELSAFVEKKLESLRLSA